MECPRSQWVLMVDVESADAEWVQIFAECIDRAVVCLEVCLRDMNHVVGCYRFRILYAFDSLWLKVVMWRVNWRARRFAAAMRTCLI